MLNLKQQASGPYETIRNRPIMYDLSHIKFLNSTEIQLFREAQEFLRLDAEDIRFRAYDLLFSCYPFLRSELSVDRYTHPDFVSLLYNTPEDVAVGIEATQYLLTTISPHSEREFIDGVSLIKHCLLKALRDVLFDDISPELMQIYSKITEHRMLDLIRASSSSSFNQKLFTNIQQLKASHSLTNSTQSKSPPINTTGRTI